MLQKEFYTVIYYGRNCYSLSYRNECLTVWHFCPKVGFKPAGGIRSAKDSLTWMILMKEELGDDWTKPDLFRIGASGLLVDIERQIFHHVTGRYAATHELPMA